MAVPPAEQSVAVVGAGIAGATCARALSESGFAVHIVDKSRGHGGRLATRRLEWTGEHGQQRSVKVDHGAPGFSARSTDFRQFLASSPAAATLARWQPRLAAGSRPLDDPNPLFVPQPDMPSLCRALLADIPRTWSFAVNRLVREPGGWRIEAEGATLPGSFDAVVLALPPAQAAPLLAPHNGDWARRAALSRMEPCWALLGVARPLADADVWDACRPVHGPLSWIMRNEARPGREAVPDEVQWVAHARAEWSTLHLEQPAAWVLGEMQAALHAVLGEAADWRHAVVHRWRYAMLEGSSAEATSPCWWEDAQRLGVCGDFLGGVGVEGAWRSAHALADAIVRGGLPSATAR